MIHETLKDKTINGPDSGFNALDVQHTISDQLRNLINTGTIQNWKFDEIEICSGQFPVIREVYDMSSEAVPGDQVVEGGKFIGTVISTDGLGHGVIMVTDDARKDYSVVDVKISVQPNFPLNYVTIDVKI